MSDSEKSPFDLPTVFLALLGCAIVFVTVELWNHRLNPDPSRQIVFSFQKMEEDEFVEAAERSGLAARKGTLRSMYRDLKEENHLALYDQSHLSALFTDLASKRLIYDGERFYTPSIGSASQERPTYTQGEKLVATETSVPLKFFLDHWMDYSHGIFTRLTRQRDVDFTFDLDREGRYGFRIGRRMRQGEAFALFSTRPAPEPDKIVPAGTTWWIAGKDLPAVSRFYQFEHAFTDHLGRGRIVSVPIDLVTSFASTLDIVKLPDGDSTIDFADAVVIDDSMVTLARQIAAPYKNRADKAKAILRFVQSFRYHKDRNGQSTKTAQAFLMVEEGDCEDASVLAVTLWEALNLDAAFLDYRSKVRGQPGHVMPALASDECCSGKGITVQGRTWLYAEATDSGWDIGDDTYLSRSMDLAMVRPYRGEPIAISQTTSRPK